MQVGISSLYRSVPLYSQPNGDDYDLSVAWMMNHE